MPEKVVKLQSTLRRKVTASKEQLVYPQPLNTNGTIKHIPESQGNFLKPGTSRLVSSVIQDTLQPLLANLALTLPNPSSTSKFNKHTSGDNTPVKPGTSEIVPFEKTSPIWKTVEALEVFRRIPQTPHFMKLESKCKEEREGKAIGMMVTYEPGRVNPEAPNSHRCDSLRGETYLPHLSRGERVHCGPNMKPFAGNSSNIDQRHKICIETGRIGDCTGKQGVEKYKFACVRQWL